LTQLGQRRRSGRHPRSRWLLGLGSRRTLRARCAAASRCALARVAVGAHRGVVELVEQRGEPWVVDAPFGEVVGEQLPWGTPFHHRAVSAPLLWGSCDLYLDQPLAPVTKGSPELIREPGPPGLVDPGS